jgi:hypothetical protein
VPVQTARLLTKCTHATVYICAIFGMYIALGNHFCITAAKSFVGHFILFFWSFFFFTTSKREFVLAFALVGNFIQIVSHQKTTAQAAKCNYFFTSSSYALQAASVIAETRSNV